MKQTPIYEATAGRSHFADGLKDIREGFENRAIWRELVRRDLYSKTKGASLGKRWIIIAQAIAISGIGLVYAQLFGMTLADYLPYLATSLITWGFMINEASDVFVASKVYLTQTHFPLSVCMFRYVTRNVIMLLYKALIILVVLVIFQVPLGWSTLIAILGVALIALAGFFTGVILGLLNARYRDIGQLVSSLIVFLFFMTPVFWRADRVGDYGWVVQYNPLYNFLVLVRSPLIGEPITYWPFLMTGGSIAVLAVLSTIVYRIHGREVIYWL